MGKGKIAKFRDNEGFSCLVQTTVEELLRGDHPMKGRWNTDFFHNDNPLVLELGCGKGEYTIDLARTNPDKNFIGIDIKGARLWKGAKYVETEHVPNAGFLRMRIEFITRLFAEGEVSEIWLTFSDPQLKKPNKRLTAPVFMERYSHIMRRGGFVHLKTDSRRLHEYSAAMARTNGLRILACGSDIYGADKEELYGSGFASVCGESAVSALFSLQTFYEKQFLERGIPITFLSFVLDHEGPWLAPDFDESEWER